MSMLYMDTPHNINSNLSYSQKRLHLIAKNIAFVHQRTSAPKPSQ